MIQVDRKYALTWMLAMLTPVCCGQAVAVAEAQGRVLDASGAAVPGAQIRMTEAETGYVRNTTTGADGSYSLPNLPVGPYALEATAEGFKTHVQSGIILQVGSSIQVDVTMQVGSVSENVVVMASAGMVETRSNSVAQVIDERRIVELPLNGRQVTDLIVISGGATPTPNANMISSKNYPSSTTMSVAGRAMARITYSMVAIISPISRTSTCHSRFQMRCRNSAWKRAALPPETACIPEALSTS